MLANALQIQYYFQQSVKEPITEEMRNQMPTIIEFNIYIGVNPDEIFEAVKQDCVARKEWRAEEKQIDGFDEWPSGYPDSGNDYMFVSHCGANKDRTKVFWTQGNKRWTYVEVSFTRGGDEILIPYADAAWQVVYGMGLCDEN